MPAVRRSTVSHPRCAASPVRSTLPSGDQRARKAIAALVAAATALGLAATFDASSSASAASLSSDEKATSAYYSHHDFGKGESRRPHSQWPLRALNVRSAWGVSRGAGVTVAIIDSGVGQSRELDGQLTSTAADFVTGDPSRVDTSDHGTAVASVIAARADGHGIAGVAPAAKVMSARIFDGFSAPRTRLVRAIRWTADQRPDVLNLSLTERPAPELRAAVRYAQSKGVIVVAGAGNDGTDTADGAPLTYPAAYRGVIAVGAVRGDRSRAGFSNAGRFVDVVAPGKRVLAADPGNTLSWYDGTSIAAPHVAGVIALMLSANPRLTAASVTRILRETATDLGVRGKDSEFGWGLVNARAAVVAARNTR